MVVPVAVVAVVVLAAGCRGGTPTAEPTTADSTTLHAPSASASPISDAVAARDNAIAAYRGMWAAYQKAGETADPSYPGLQTYVAGDALETLTNGLKSVRDRGLVIRGEIVLNPRVTGAEITDKPTSIDITDCADDSNSLLYRTSGELYNDKPGGRRLVLATVKDTGGGTWKVVSFGARDVGTC